jgi:phosphoglycolate phosphatase
VIRNVIFDLDGTLADSVPGIQWSVEQALAACSMPRKCPDLTPLIGPPIRDILAVVSGVRESDKLNLLEGAFRSAYDSLGWRKTTCQPGAEEILRRLHACSCVLWLVTNKPERATAAILTELGLRPFFAEVLCRDSRTPPFISKGEMLANLLEHRTLDGAGTIMVGDTLEDCRAAAEAAIDCVIVPHGYGHGLDAAFPDGCRTIAGWDELLSICQAGPRGEAVGGGRTPVHEIGGSE